MGTLNTRIHYLYRDADNYKMPNTCIVAGPIDVGHIALIMECLNDEEYFIPRRVGLPERRFDKIDPHSDHCWFELSSDSFELTDRPSDLNLTAEELVANFQKAKGHWNDSWMIEEETV